jgi:hypothetical protein
MEYYFELRHELDFELDEMYGFLSLLGNTFHVLELATERARPDPLIRQFALILAEDELIIRIKSRAILSHVLFEDKGKRAIHIYPNQAPEYALLKPEDIDFEFRDCSFCQMMPWEKVAVIAKHKDTGLDVEVSEIRTQSKNIELAIKRLSCKVYANKSKKLITTEDV